MKGPGRPVIQDCMEVKKIYPASGPGLILVHEWERSN